MNQSTAPRKSFLIRPFSGWPFSAKPSSARPSSTRQWLPIAALALLSCAGGGAPLPYLVDHGQLHHLTGGPILTRSSVRRAGRHRRLGGPRGAGSSGVELREFSYSLLPYPPSCFHARGEVLRVRRRPDKAHHASAPVSRREVGGFLHTLISVLLEPRAVAVTRPLRLLCRR